MSGQIQIYQRGAQHHQLVVVHQNIEPIEKLELHRRVRQRAPYPLWCTIGRRQFGQHGSPGLGNTLVAPAAHAVQAAVVRYHVLKIHARGRVAGEERRQSGHYFTRRTVQFPQLRPRLVVSAKLPAAELLVREAVHHKIAARSFFKNAQRFGIEFGELLEPQYFFHHRVVAHRHRLAGIGRVAPGAAQHNFPFRIFYDFHPINIPEWKLERRKIAHPKHLAVGGHLGDHRVVTLPPGHVHVAVGGSAEAVAQFRLIGPAHRFDKRRGVFAAVAHGRFHHKTI